MANMTAAQVRKALSSMTHYVPAFMAAADIIESAEAAEAGITEQQRRKDELLAEIGKYESQVIKAQNQAAEAQAKTAAALEETRNAENKRDELQSQIANIEKELSNARLGIRQNLKADEQRAANEVTALQAVIDKKKAEHEAAENAFAKWKKEHGL